MGAFVAVALAAADAKADVDVYWQLAAGGSARWLPRAPALKVSRSVYDLRDISAGELASTGTLSFLGGHADVGLAIDDRWHLPIFGLGGYAALGSYDRVLASHEGSMFELRPWTAVAFDLLLPGVGVRIKERRWLFTIDARPVFTGVRVQTRVALGSDWVDGPTAYRSEFALRAELGVCRRFDPTSRGCLTVAPNVYEYGWGNGGTISIRWELGP